MSANGCQRRVSEGGMGPNLLPRIQVGWAEIRRRSAHRAVHARPAAAARHPGDERPADQRPREPRPPPAERAPAPRRGRAPAPAGTPCARAARAAAPSSWSSMIGRSANPPSASHVGAPQPQRRVAVVDAEAPLQRVPAREPAREAVRAVEAQREVAARAGRVAQRARERGVRAGRAAASRRAGTRAARPWPPRRRRSAGARGRAAPLSTRGASGCGAGERRRCRRAEPPSAITTSQRPGSAARWSSSPGSARASSSTGHDDRDERPATQSWKR